MGVQWLAFSEIHQMCKGGVYGVGSRWHVVLVSYEICGAQQGHSTYC